MGCAQPCSIYRGGLGPPDPGALIEPLLQGQAPFHEPSRFSTRAAYGILTRLFRISGSFGISSLKLGMAANRDHWSSRLGFVLAAAGSAIGLGNIWKFPYITGENGGGAFVLVYLAAIALVGLPVMTAEILLGRAAQRAPVGAFKRLAGSRSSWVALGWLGVAASFVILSYYSIVAGWALHYTWLSLTGQLFGLGPDGVELVFSRCLPRAA